MRNSRSLISVNDLSTKHQSVFVSCIRCTQYASEFGKLSSGHRTGKGQFSFQSQRKAMPKNAQEKGKSLSRVRFFAIPWTAGYQAPLSMGFSRQEYWSTRRAFFSKECSNYCTIALISHASKVMLKIFQPRLHNM